MQGMDGLPLLGPCGPRVKSLCKGNRNSLGIPHVLSCFDLQVSGFFGERGFDIGHGCYGPLGLELEA